MKAPQAPSWPLPRSSVFRIVETGDTGRGVFAHTDIPSNTPVLTTSSGQSPLAHVILRPYRREVCAWCFAYDRGREWKIRDTSRGTAFCTGECQTNWLQNNDDVCLEAFRSIESFTRAQSKRQTAVLDSGQDHETARNGSVSEQYDRVKRSWAETELRAQEILKARLAEKPTRIQRISLRKASELTTDADILAYVLSGVVAAHRARMTMVSNDVTVPSNRNNDAQVLLPSLFQLTADESVFVENQMTPSPLRDYTISYLILLSALPKALIEIVTPLLIINLASRAAHNAFSIRPEGTTDGDQSGEFLGWGLWPEASFFNHSCKPNVKKARKGRLWSFQVDTDLHSPVPKDEQLCITYLGGDEKDLDVSERRKRLQEQWGFPCMCKRCLDEANKEHP